MEKRIRIITGHYGSGKTEVSLNYALYLASRGKQVALADLDIVNPFFRSREKTEMLEQKGIRVIASAVKGRQGLDLPALDPGIHTVFDDRAYDCVVDLGGDPAGTRVLGRYRKKIPWAECDMWMVVNANRPDTRSVEDVLAMLRGIEQAAGLKVGGLINNTHLMRETRGEDILRGNELCVKAGGIAGIPVMYNCISGYTGGAIEEKIKGPVFRLEILLRPNWM